MSERSELTPCTLYKYCTYVILFLGRSIVVQLKCLKSSISTLSSPREPAYISPLSAGRYVLCVQPHVEASAFQLSFQPSHELYHFCLSAIADEYLHVYTLTGFAVYIFRSRSFCSSYCSCTPQLCARVSTGENRMRGTRRTYRTARAPFVIVREWSTAPHDSLFFLQCRVISTLLYLASECWVGVG